MSQNAEKKMDHVASDQGVSFETDEAHIGHLVFDLPGEKINKLSRAVFERLDGILEACRKNKNLKAVIISSGKSDIFIAGADISEIGKITDAQEAERMSGAAQHIFNKLEEMSIPMVVAIHGACLGGGLELAMACHYRIATDDPATKLGLPEVNLGIIPGAGGTQRMPKLVGVQKALDLICSGRAIDAKAAKKIGLIDRMVPKHLLLEIAYETAKKLSIKRFNKGFHFFDMRKPLGWIMNPPKASQEALNFFLDETPIGRRIVFEKARESVLKKTQGHYPAPLKAIEAIAAASGSKKGYAKEASLFGELAVTDISKNLIQIFYATEAIKKDNGVSGLKDFIAPKIANAGVLGAGIMGGGIAQLLAHKGVRVRMKDINHPSLAKGFKAAHDIFYESVKRRKMTERDLHHKMAMITGTTKYDGFKHMDVVVEAVVEDIGLKQKVLREVETHVPSSCVIATNTSSLSISEIAKGAQHPGRVVGMHFFNPVHRMPLVEIIPGQKTEKETIAMIFNFAKRLGKTPVVVGDGPGFLVNRLLGIYLNEAAYLFESGVDIETLDSAMTAFGMPMGPFRLLDEVGIATAHKVGKILKDGLGERFHSPSVLDTVLGDGRGGKAQGTGFYLYEGGKGDGKKVDASVYDLWPARKAKNNVANEDIVDRLILSMVNEAARTLAEGIAKNSRDIDIAMIMGTGFPPFLGGLMAYANKRGLPQIVERLKKLAKSHGERFLPFELLERTAKENATL